MDEGVACYWLTPLNASDDNMIKKHLTAFAWSSSAIFLVIGNAIAAPTLITQPADVAVTQGGQTVFSVCATGVGTLTYQWMKDGAPIGGATSPARVIDPVQYGDAGNYTVDVTDSGGTTTSREAGLTVNAPLAGSVDFGFFTNTTVNGYVLAIAVQSDGKVLIAGNFTTVNGVARSYIARLNSDGSTDYAFGNGVVYPNNMRSLAVQSDGKVLIGGSFTTVNGVARQNLARLNSDGTLDTTFGDGLAGPNSTVSAVVVQSDGKVLIVGGFNLVNGVARGCLARLNSDGSLDTGFANGLAGANGAIGSVAIQNDGKVLIGGSFTTIHGVTCGNLARLNSDGSLDTTFGNGLAGADSSVFSVAIQSDGKVIIGGYFAMVNGVARGRIARLNSDGSLDAGFGNGLVGANATVYSVAVQSDGKVMIGGSFTMVNGAARGCMARLNSDGTLDTGFGNGLAGADFSVQSMAVQSGGKVLIGGTFTTVNGVARGYLARLNSGGSLDTGFAIGVAGANATVQSVAVQSDGKVLIGGDFTAVNGVACGYLARLNRDGSLDTTFGNGLAGANSAVQSVAIQSDGKVLIGGSFTNVNNTARGYIARLNSDGTLDTAFGNGLAGANSVVSAVTMQSDGKVLIAGGLTAVNGTVRTRIARLNNDGSLDTGFVGAVNAPTCLAMQGDGKVLVGNNWGKAPKLYASLVRLNVDGSGDTSFSAFTPIASYNNRVNSVAVQSDGKVLIGGSFTIGGVIRGGILRLNSNGTIDTTFGTGLAGPNNLVWAVAVQSDGKVLIAGTFTTVNGVARGGIARLNSDGTLDTTFGNGLAGGVGATSVAVQDDGQVLIAGSISVVNGTPRANLARLVGVSDTTLASLAQSAGTPTPAFSAGTLSYASTVPNGTTGMTVTPAVNGANLMIEVRANGGTYSTVASGTPSDTLALNVGDNTIDVRVTTTDGTSSTYTLSVTRLDLPLFTWEIQSPYGIGTPTTGLSTNALGSVLTAVMANPAPAGSTRYVCTGWSMIGNEPTSGTTASCVMTLTNNAVLTWLWTTNYYLNTAAVPNGSVTVDSGWQPLGVTTQLTAVASPYYHFVNWSGDATGTSNPIALLMDQPKSVTANFAANVTTTHPTPEAWLAQYGITSDFDHTSLDDTDHDGLANWQEYVAGTDPTNTASRLLMTAIGPVIGTNYTETVVFYPATNFVFQGEPRSWEDHWETQRVYAVTGHCVTWPSVTGRMYNVEVSTNLINWTALEGASNLLGTSPANTVTDSPPAQVKFYRVNVRLP